MNDNDIPVVPYVPETEDSPIGEPESEPPAADEKPAHSVSSDLIRGHINTIILRALYDGDKYGYEIISEIEHKSHGQYSLKQPSLYSALKRLEKDGYVTSYWGGSVGGGRRKYFSLTESGKQISEQNQSEWEYSRTVIDSLISDKDFDFSNPAPTAVNMRMLRNTTSRVPHTTNEEDDLAYEPDFNDGAEVRELEDTYRARLAELEEQRAALQRERDKFDEEMRARSEILARERTWREEEIGERERALAEKRAELEALRSRMKDDGEKVQSDTIASLEARVCELESQLEERRAQADEHIRELEAQLEEVRTQSETHISELETELSDRQQTIELMQSQREDAIVAERKLSEETLEEERRLYAEQIETVKRQANEAFEEEQRRHREELAAQEQRILAEQEELFRKREQQLLHKNYLELVNAPPAEEEVHDYTYYTPPAEEPAKETEPEPEDYRTVVHRLYANALSSDTEPLKEDRVRSLDGIDFTELETRAAQDGIRIQTAGGTKGTRADASESIVHKGKALFFSGILTFLFCLAVGSIVLGVRASAGIPVFYPYLIWAVGLAVLLVTGLAYANHFGERSLRRTGPVILNAVIVYILLVIVTLIVALSARADFSRSADLATFVIVPVIFFLGVIVFGVAYYLQVRPKKD